MKQNIVLKMRISDEKIRSKALSIVAGKDGVTSVKIFGEEKDKVAVIGDDIDIVALKTSLDKKVGRTILVSVTVLLNGDGSGNDNDNDDEEEGQLTNYPGSSYGQYHQPYHSGNDEEEGQLTNYPGSSYGQYHRPYHSYYPGSSYGQYHQPYPY